MHRAAGECLHCVVQRRRAVTPPRHVLEGFESLLLGPFAARPPAGSPGTHLPTFQLALHSGHRDSSCQLQPAFTATPCPLSACRIAIPSKPRRPSSRPCPEDGNALRYFPPARHRRHLGRTARGRAAASLRKAIEIRLPSIATIPSQPRLFVSSARQVSFVSDAVLASRSTLQLRTCILLVRGANLAPTASASVVGCLLDALSLKTSHDFARNNCAHCSSPLPPTLPTPWLSGPYTSCSDQPPVFESEHPDR